MKALLFAVLAATAMAESGSDLDALLDEQAQPLTIEKGSLPTIFYGIGRTYKFNVTVDRDVAGETSLRFNGGSVRQLLEYLTDQNDLFLEVKENRVNVRRTKTAFFFIEYPQVNRKATSTTSVTLNPSSANGFTGVGGSMALPAAPTMAASGGSMDSTQLNIAESSEDSFWDRLEADIKANMNKEYDSKLVLNRFSGIVAIDTTVKRGEFWKNYIRLINEAINAQVMVEVRIDEVTLTDASKLGVDWQQVQTSLQRAVAVNFLRTATNVTSVGTRTLPGDTLIGNIASGKLSLVLHALQDQGTVSNISKPTIRLMNNQKGFVKVGEDRTFYSLYSNVRIDQGVAASQTVSQEVYQRDRQTFGVVLPVTASISRDGYITLVLEPARTQLNGIEESPDKKQTSPNTGDERISTMLRLKSGETAIIGGLRSQTSGTQHRSIPVLGALPFIGQAFRSDATSKLATELVVSVTAQVVP